MMPNEEQLKSSLRWLITTFGGMLAGWFAAKGWFTAQQVLDILNSPTFIGLIFSIGGGIWGLFVHTEKNAVAVVNTIAKEIDSPVKGVITENTVAGREMAKNIEGPTVVAGTPAAIAIAK